MIRVLPFINNPKDLDLTYKTDLDFWDCFGRKISPTYKRRNMVGIAFSPVVSVGILTSIESPCLAL